MEKEKRQDIVIKICCLVAALVLWMYVRINENPVITSTVKYVPVQILNEESLTEKSLILMPKQEFYVNVTVKGTTSAVSEIDKNKDFKLVADLSGYALIPGENKIQVTVKQSPAGISVVNSDSLVLKIDIDNYKQKEFTVEANILGKVPEGYYNEENTISQNKATVEGPERYVNQVEKVVADVDISNSESDISQNYKLKAVDANSRDVSGVSIYPEYTQVVSTIKLGKKVPVNVVTTGSASNSIIIQDITPSESSVELIGDKDVIQKIDKVNTKSIDLSTIDEGKTVTVELDLPEGVKVAGDSKTVDVTFTVKKSVEKSLTLPIEYTGVGEGLKESHSIQEVQITLKGFEEDINSLNTGNIKASIDLAGLGAGKHEATIKISGVPSGIQITEQSEKTVQVDITTTADEETGNNDN